MKSAPILSLLTALGSLFLCSCQTATVESRIQEHPQIFSKLSTTDQSSVASGSIAEGMHKDAVFLAWGAPQTRTVGGGGGKTTETWVYRTMEPIVRNRVGLGIGYGGGRRYGRYGHRRCSSTFGSFSYAPTISYVPRDAAKVVFQNDRVVSWQERG